MSVSPKCISEWLWLGTERKEFKLGSTALHCTVSLNVTVFVDTRKRGTVAKQRIDTGAIHEKQYKV